MTYIRCLLLILLTTPVFGQFRLKPLAADDPGLPEWARAMYAPSPNVFDVERLREAYYSNHPFEPTDYTAYYDHWRRFIQPYLKDDGTIEPILEINSQPASANERSIPWRFVGPEVNYRRRNSSTDPVIPISWHANVYCIDRSMSNPDVVYCGTENGGVYKSTDHGMTWNYLSLATDQVTVTSIAVDPLDENKVLCCADGRLFKSTDGGVTWNRIASGPFANRTIDIWQLLYHPTNSSVVFAAAADALYRSSDGGSTWTSIFSGECQSVAFNPLDASTVYALRYDPVAQIPYFQKSTDTGFTFIPKPSGWFSVPAVDAGLIQSYGGRIAV
ncbi:MAG: WD40/YVTN/BNR-like repeat-containing protein, partial [Flavobacteriales bacterium]